jgi:sarcosine oxidase
VGARDAWRRWEDRAGEVLVGDEGVVILGATEGDEDSLTAAGVEWLRIDAAGSRHALPLLASGGPTGLLELHGGAIRVERTLAVLRGWLEGRVIESEMLGIEVRDDASARVETAGGLWECERVFVCAGAETESIARALGCSLGLENSVHLRATFAVSEPHPSATNACLLDRSGAFGPRVYASPIGYAEYAVGLSGAEGAVELEGQRFTASDGLAVALEKVEQYARTALPALGSVVGTRLCRVTELPVGDDSFALWRVGPVALLAGHNLFKFAPVLGDMVVAAAYGAEDHELLAPPPSEP